MSSLLYRVLTFALLLVPAMAHAPSHSGGAKTVRVFIFAGQSNMLGADSDKADIQRFPPFAGLEEAQPDVRFHYSIGRNDRDESDGWVDLAPIKNFVGPELSFARAVKERIKDPLAIIKVATGGTSLAEDWNPDKPGGFELYPLALRRIQGALAALDRKGVKYQVEGFMWHQGENDMFDDERRAAYGANLANFLARWRKDLDEPDLRFYIGELCTKTVWGMDNRANMHGIETAQRAVASEDPLATYIPTNHVGVEIGGGAGLHYHYGTLGQLQHGLGYADAYLAHVGSAPERTRTLRKWPYKEGAKVTLFVLAGHRNMEGERAFVSELKELRGTRKLMKDDPTVAFRYHVGGGIRVSDGWEPLGPAGYSETFGPELSFAAQLKRSFKGPFAIAKYTHSGSQILDWTPEGSEAETRNVYPGFVEFIEDSVESLEAKGHEVELAGVFYHFGENDTAWGRFRKKAAERLGEIAVKTREDLERPDLRWFVSSQEPVDDKSVNAIDVIADVNALAAQDPLMTHLEAFDLPGRAQTLVLTTEGIVALGERIAKAFLAGR